MKRISRLVLCAERARVNLAFENIRLPQHLEAVFSAFAESERVGLCYDSGHQHYWTNKIDWLSIQKERLFAIHLHDNWGDKDAHLPPLEGNIDWKYVMSKILQSNYCGSLTLETEMPKGTIDGMTKIQEAETLVRSFLNNAYRRGKELIEIVEKLI